jgi:2-succinyl-6-hydroxy-2,4-cyclohexadiene-1-carboxylate synthase
VRSFEAEVERLCALVERHARAPVHLAGYSMGGRVALAMLVSRPSLFRAATLIGTRDGLYDPAERKERAAWESRWVRLLEGKGLDAFLRAWEALPLWETQREAPADRLAAQREVRASHSPAGLAHALQVLGLAAMPALRERLRGLRIPVTLMTGALDPKFERLAEPVARQLPDGRRLTVPGAGHNLLLERPEAVADVLNRNGSG